MFYCKRFINSILNLESAFLNIKQRINASLTLIVSSKEFGFQIDSSLIFETKILNLFIIAFIGNLFLIPENKSVKKL